jgi:hypothetical protein
LKDLQNKGRRLELGERGFGCFCRYRKEESGGRIQRIEAVKL